MIQVTLKGGVIKEYENGISVAEIAKELSAGLFKAACACKINGTLSDLRETLQSDCEVEILTFDSTEGKKVFWHSASHVLAQAVKRLYPTAKLAIGPAIDNGFYYDFEVEKSFSPQELEKIEAEMKKIVKENLIIERFTLQKEGAMRLMQEKGEHYKIELIEEHSANGETLSFYRQGDFTDLCAGPHLMSLATMKAIKLTQCTGAYWRGDATKHQLARVYGTAFPKASELEAYLTAVEEAKKRDHNTVGRALKYFTTSDPIGQGLPLLMPKGSKVLQTLQRFVEDESEKRGYLITKTPSMAKNDLYKISGHWDHYKDGMFIMGDEEKDSEVFALRPMTCPFQFMIYNSELHSYRELPIRYSETASLFRNESSGEMHGLIRVRQFTLSDAHTMVTPEQLETEFKMVVDFIKYLMATLGIQEDVSYRFSKWDGGKSHKYIDNAPAWEKTQDIMREILNHLDLDYVEADDEAAFYGPKLDIQMKNVHGKEDTIITIQIDFALAERFGMLYMDADGQRKHPYIIHHSLIGCYERTLALLIEKFAGALPTWLAPTKAVILPISEHQHEVAHEVGKKLRDAGVKVHVDDRNEKIGYRIRESQLEKYPYMLVIGEKEAETNEVSVRSRKDGDKGAMSLDAFIAEITQEIETRAL